MGVSLNYSSTEPVSPEDHQKLITLMTEANKNYEWWCENIWISSQLNDNKCAFGSTKLYCMIDDPAVDHYMAYLDVGEIIRFLSSIAKELGIEWQLNIEGSTFGKVTTVGPDDELEVQYSSFLTWFGSDITKLQSQSREDILAEWSDR